MLKIIIDPHTNCKWLVTNEGIEKTEYWGAVSWGKLFGKNFTKDEKRRYLHNLFNKRTSLERAPYDNIMSPTIAEYNQIADLLKKCHCKYNKKTKQLIDNNANT